MIIKSMARKEATFSQLYDYITRENDCDHNHLYSHNFILRDRDSILNEFQRNSDLLSKRKNGNYLYHEIISITRAKGISTEKQKEHLQSIVHEYVQTRAKGCLVFGGLHVEKDNNLHYHLIISANQLENTKRQRLTKEQFSEVKKGLEKYVLEKFPELEQEKLITLDNKERKEKRSSYKEQEFKKRTGKQTQKEFIAGTLKSIFSNSKTKAEYKELLKINDIEEYTRGKTIGFLDTTNSKKYRLKTLGIVDEYEKMNLVHVNLSLHGNTKGQKESIQKVSSSNSKTKENKTPNFKNEWIFGDFSEREKMAKREKSKKIYEGAKDPNRSTFNTAKDVFNEWIFGDFSARNERAKEQKIKDNYERDYKNPKKDSPFSDITKEWVLGDFTERDEQQKSKERLDKRKKQKAKEELQKQRSAGENKNEKEHSKGGKGKA